MSYISDTTITRGHHSTLLCSSERVTGEPPMWEMLYQNVSTALRWMLGKTSHTCRFIGRRRIGASLLQTIGSSPDPVIQATACRQAFCKARTRPGLMITSRCSSSALVTTSPQEKSSRLIVNSKTRILTQEVSDNRR